MNKPQVTEEWIEEKATWLIEEGCMQHIKPSFIKDFIRSLVEEMMGVEIIPLQEVSKSDR